MRPTDDDRFCPRCDIDLGLHGEGIDPDDVDPADCENAARKEALLRSFPFGPLMLR